MNITTPCARNSHPITSHLADRKITQSGIRDKQIKQAYIKRYLDYSEATGIFKWKEKPAKKIIVGALAGCMKTTGYMTIGIRGKYYYSHRLAWLYVTGEWPDQIDHINGIKSDNRLINLRSVTSFENQKNRPIQKNNKSGINGVIWREMRGKWDVYIKTNGRMRYITNNKDFFEACCARKSAELKYGFHENHGRIV